MLWIHAGHTWWFWCFHFGRWRCFWASFEKFFDEIAQANYRWELTEEQGKYFERYLRLTSRQKTQNKYHILTSVPLYIKSAIGFRSFGCCNWSESLIWHKTLSLLLGPMLIDVHLSSIWYTNFCSDYTYAYRPVMKCFWGHDPPMHIHTLVAGTRDADSYLYIRQEWRNGGKTKQNWLSNRKC